jgi:hypothetical protein
MHRWGKIVLFVGITVATAGCPKDRTDFNQGAKSKTFTITTRHLSITRRP